MIEQTSLKRTMFTRQQGVIEQLREKIMMGTLGAGDRLLEVALSDELQVSRTPIREALIVLAEDGLVEYRPNRGYVVRRFTLPYIMNAYVVREALEGLACRLAAEKGVDENTRLAMESCLSEGDELLSGRHLSASAREPWREVNDRLHQLILGAAGNDSLEHSLAFATRIPYASSRVVHWFEEDDAAGLFQLRMVHGQHHMIIRAIIDGEGYRAETVMRGHISYAAEHIRAKFLANASSDDGDQSEPTEPNS